MIFWAQILILCEIIKPKQRACETCQIHLRSIKLAMATYTEAQGLPTISADYRVGNTKISVHKNLNFSDRETKRKKTEKNFPRAYFEATGKKLPSQTKGLVRLAFGRIPYDWDIQINPKPEQVSSQRVRCVDDKVMELPYYFETHQYWYEGGKITPILGDKEVLSESLSKKAVEKLLKIFESKEKAIYIGEFFADIIGYNQKRPYRFFDCGQRKICLDLTNGNIFFLEEFPDKMEALPKKFVFGNIIFKKDDYSADFIAR